MTEHTPGPWFAQECAGTWVIRPVGTHGQASGWLLAQLTRPTPGLCMYESRGGSPEANARLIEAAPKLLAACKAALGAFEHNHCIDWSDLERAIAQAEGRS